MKDFFATEKLRTIYPKVKEFLETEIYPNEHTWLSMPFEEVAVILRKLKTKAQTTGAWNLYHTEEHGGPGLNLVEIAQLCELLGSTYFGHFTFNCQAPDAGNMELLLLYATEEMKEKYMHPLLEGDLRSCFSMTEPDNAGSNPVKMSTTAVRVGDEYVINGRKWFTSSADGAAFAIVMAITNPNAENPYQRASMIIVPTDSEGFKLERNLQIFGHAGSSWDSHAEISYTNVRVPVSNLMAGEGDGFKLAQQRLGPGRIHHCMRWIGQCERAFDLMCTRAATRGVGEGFLGEKQMIQDFIATSRAEIDAARWMVLHTAHSIQTRGAKDAAQEISTIKFYVANVLHQVIDRAIQVHGGMGVTEDSLLSVFFREARTARIYDGPDEAHKASLARNILKGYGLKISNN